MLKYLFGIFMGIVFILVLVSTIYPEVYEELMSGAFWAAAVEVVRGWIAAIKAMVN